MARTSENSKIHIRLISAMVNKLIKEGYKVSADHIGYPNGRPEEFRGYIPDICAFKDNKEIFIEADTCDSLNSIETKLQWVALSSSSDIDFSVIVPKSCVGEAKEKAKEWKVNVKTFWTLEINKSNSQ